MSIGIAIFASVAFLLVVYHKTFRKVFWIAGISIVVGVLIIGGAYLYDRYPLTAAIGRGEQRVEAQETTIKGSVSRNEQITSQ